MTIEYYKVMVPFEDTMSNADWLIVGDYSTEEKANKAYSKWLEKYPDKKGVVHKYELVLDAEYI